MRGFVRGVVWGSLAAAGGLVVVSQVAGPVPRAGAEQAGLGQGETVAVAVTPEAVPSPAPEAAAPEAVTAEPAAPQAVADSAPVAEEPAVPAAPPAADGAAVRTYGTGLDKPDAPLVQSDAPDAVVSAAPSVDLPVMPAPAERMPSAAPPVPSGAGAPSVPEADSVAVPAPPPADPPQAPSSALPGERMASAGAVGPLPDAPGSGGAPIVVAPPESPALPQAEGAPTPVDLPPPPPLTPEEEALVQPLPVDGAAAEPAPADPLPEPNPQRAEAQGSLPPAQALGDQAPDVVTGRLPRIGDDPEPDAGTVPETAGPEATAPLRRYARPFDNAAQKPLFAILLQDDGGDGVNRAELAALDLPLSIVIDPLSDGAAARAAIWRAGGQEVVMAGSGIPQGASPGDLEQSFQVLATRLPEAVAVIDADGTAFQNDGPLATQVVPILVEQGRGLVTFDQGLNAADQMARRDGLPSAMIFRRIDGEGEDSPVIRRYLDRAAFKAAQEGRVIVIGSVRPETVAGIMEWAADGRAATVAVAPISAMLRAE